MNAQLSASGRPVLTIAGLAKHFDLHLQQGVRLPVLEDFALQVRSGESVVLDGPSGAGKSTLLRLIYGDYLASGGAIVLSLPNGQRHDLLSLPARQRLLLRRRAIGYVSQFLRVIPRVSCEAVVAETLLLRGVLPDEATERARALLERLHIPRRLWSVPPATFSGGEQQRVNIARVFVADWPLLLLDEPTASLDGANRASVVELIEEARAAGSAILAVLHDQETREQVATRLVTVRSPLQREAMA